MPHDRPESSAQTAGGSDAIEPPARRLVRALEAGALAEWSVALPSERWLIATRLDEIYGDGAPRNAAAANADTATGEALADSGDGTRDVSDRSTARLAAGDGPDPDRTPLTSGTIGARLLEEDVPAVAAGYRRLVATGEPWQVEARMTRADGEPRWIRIEGEASAAVGGVPVRLSGLVRDVTELKRLRQANSFLADLAIPLAQIDDYDDTLQQVASEAVPFLADRCIIEFVSADGALHRVADSLRPPIDPPQLPPLHPADRVPAAPLIDHIVSERRTLVLVDIGEKEVRGLSATEEQRRELEGFKPCDYIGAPLAIEGRCFGVLAILTRRDGRRFAEQELGLVERVAERISSALESARLYATLKHADEAKSRFLALLSHEIRNPLGAIVSGIESIRDGVVTPPDRLSLAMIERQTASLSHLLDDLLDIARLDADKLELELEWVSVTRAMEDALASVSSAIRDKRQRLVSRMPTPDIAVRADRVRLEQILVNLLANASRYTPNGGTVELTAHRDAERVVIEVVDTGVGLSEDERARIFELFEQVREDGGTPSGGLGLGLSLVRKLATLHGGTVSAESPGKGLGSRFRLTLPHTRGNGASDATTASADPTPPPSAGEPLEVLLIDDNDDAAEALERVIRRLGHEVRTSHTGHDGAAACRRSRPDLVLLDIGLPDIDGYAVARLIREHQREAAVRPSHLVALTGYGQSGDRRRALEAGFDEHVVKPARLAALRRVLDTAARKRAAGTGERRDEEDESSR